MKKILSLLAVIYSCVSMADVTFTNITSDDFSSITKEFSANTLHNSMIGASKMGTVFGFQVGLAGAQTATPKTNDIVKRNAGSELPNLYSGGIVAAVGIPFGIAFEGVFFPGVKVSGASLSATSLALKYNINSAIPVLPVNLALRGIYSNSDLKFDQTVSSVQTSIANKNSVTGVQLLLSPMLVIVEPYIGVGLLTGTNELSVTGSTTVFDSTFSSAQSEKKSESTTQMLAGVEFNLALVKFGVEYSQAFDTSRTGLKLAFGF